MPPPEEVLQRTHRLPCCPLTAGLGTMPLPAASAPSACACPASAVRLGKAVLPAPCVHAATPALERPPFLFSRPGHEAAQHRSRAERDAQAMSRCGGSCLAAEAPAASAMSCRAVCLARPPCASGPGALTCCGSACCGAVPTLAAAGPSRSYTRRAGAWPLCILFLAPTLPSGCSDFCTPPRATTYAGCCSRRLLQPAHAAVATEQMLLSSRFLPNFALCAPSV